MYKLKLKPIFIGLTLLASLTLNNCKKDNNGDDVPLKSEREIAVDDYNNLYLGSAVSDPLWTGNTTSCVAGSASQSTNEMVIKRINYFRKIVGLNDNTTLDATKFPMYQEAALMMKANSQLSHTPPTSWKCYTTLGANGAQTSNLSLGNHSVNSVTAFMADNGSSNFAVGHRRWILHSAKTQFSYGTTNSSMSLGCIGTAGGNTLIPEFIAYPPKNYIPQNLVFARWSFGIPGADFSSATVTMSGPAGAVTLKVVSTTNNGYGDNTVVWEPTGIVTNSTADVVYKVTVEGIKNAPKTSYTYSTTLIKI